MTTVADRRRSGRTRMEDASLHLGLMMALTFVTGIVDAGGYLGLDRVFVGNMTGNVVILGMGAAGADGLPVLGPVLALVAFVVGAGAGGIALRGHSSGWGTRVTLMLGLAYGLIAAGAATVGVMALTERTQISAAVMTAAAMGVQAAVARKVGIAEMTTVVVTSTITVWAIEFWSRPGWATFANRRLLAIAAIFVGALLGAFLLAIGPLWVVFAVAAAVGWTATAVGHLRSVR
ncbi:YoaK family protein [Gordonia sp. PKS22-38]|uniref:YoaK family protein n=1 Tax=Gordonia prachuapensis TaxID=3115651 RepID=A0ABU7MTB9_9ACTN|nr:YoaK family protein [Gordonia sp. PKS22-38]